MSQRRRLSRALRVVAKSGDVADVYVEGIIEQPSAAAFREQLAQAKGAKVLNVHFNSDGGVVTEGMAMYNALRQFPGKKVGIVEGIAASMASVILMACDEVKVAKGAYVMIHNPSGGVMGGSEDMRKAADEIDRMRGELLDIYEARTGIDRAKLEKMLDAETYFTAEEAVTAGIADAVETFEAKIDLRIVARLDQSKIPAGLSAAAKAAQGAKGKAMTKAEKKAALEKEMSALKAKMADLDDDEEETSDTEEEPHDEEDDDKDKPKDEEDEEEKKEAKALLKLVKTVTGSKSAAVAAGKLVGLLSKASAQITDTRASVVTAAIKAGKLPPAMKDWALEASDKAFNGYLASVGGIKLGPTHKEPKDGKAPEGELTEVEAIVAKQLGLPKEEMLKVRAAAGGAK